MARKVIGPTGSRRRRWLLLSCLFVAAVSAVVFIPGALANSVKNLTFEVSDANIVQNDTATPKYDWANFFNSAGARSPVLPDASRPNYTASSFVRDFNTTTDRKGNTVFDTSDSSTYTIGSKDILDVNGWSCTPANNVTDKGDIMNAYAVAYTDPASGHKFMFFALERNANAGDANVAFWFLGGSASCPAAGGSFTGTHSDGDLLVVSAFTNGGTVSTINAYEWQNGALNTTPVAAGGDCRDGTLTGDPTCATSNTSALTGIPWQTMNKTDGVGHTLQSGEFFEGGIDLSAPSVGLANKCFNTFIPDTRSSQSLTATLYDFALGSLGECTTTFSTTPSTTSVTLPTTTAASPNASSVTVHDTAHLNVSGLSSFSGTLSFHLCGPTPLSDANYTLCTSGGVAAGSSTVTTNGDHDSSNMVLTKAGRYCWRGDFVHITAGVPDGHDSTVSECFTVNPVTPSLSTSATNQTLDNAQTFGNSIDDTATLSGTANEPGSGGDGDGSINPTTAGAVAGGTIIIKAYGPFDASHTPASTDCTAAKLVYTSNVAVTGDGTSYTASSGSGGTFTPGSPGLYLWVATYAGDSPNTNAASDVGCGSSAEQSFVHTIPTQITTSESIIPNDSATITSGASGDNLAAGGTVTFRLFKATGSGATAKTALQNCQADTGAAGDTGLVYSQARTLTGGSHSETVGTTNTATSVSADGLYYWRVTYAPAAADTAHTGIQSNCVENTNVTFTGDSGPGTAFP